MTYRQVLEEFDEKFAWAIGEKADEELFDGYKGIKSFLKQSFIKYLQGEVERLRKSLDDCIYETEDEKALAMTIIYNQITHINNQIKEIEEIV